LLGKPELTRLLETPTQLKDGRAITYALGLTVEPWRDGVREVSHGGATAGYRTFLARFPEAHTSIAVWCNVAQANAGGLAHRVMDIVLPRPTKGRTAPTPIAAATREAIVGVYRDPRNDDIVSLATAGEYVRVTAPVSDTLRDEGNGRYSTSAGITLSFEPAGAKAKRLRLDVGSEPTRELVAVPPIDTSRIARADFVGRYRSAELDWTIVIHETNGRLAARIDPDDDVEIVPTYVDGFRATTRPMALRFVRNASGKVVAFQAFAGRALHVRFDRLAGR
jgi:hypothetical protein